MLHFYPGKPLVLTASPNSNHALRTCQVICKHLLSTSHFLWKQKGISKHHAPKKLRAAGEDGYFNKQTRKDGTLGKWSTRRLHQWVSEILGDGTLTKAPRYQKAEHVRQVMQGTCAQQAKKEQHDKGDPKQVPTQAGLKGIAAAGEQMYWEGNGQEELRAHDHGSEALRRSW